jgi:hypothetical protein
MLRSRLRRRIGFTFGVRTLRKFRSVAEQEYTVAKPSFAPRTESSARTSSDNPGPLFLWHLKSRAPR